MGLTGKYDFDGIQNTGARGLKTLFPWVPNFILELAVNWLANKGLVLLNVMAAVVDGKIDIARLDRAIDDGIRRVEKSHGNLTKSEIEDIDNAVIQAADQALPYGRPPKP